jgi:membrane protease YdiL (CAAX protease family)
MGWLGGIILLSVILGWAYNNTGSVLIVMVLHAMVNTADILLPLAPDQIVSDGVIIESAVATVTVTQLAVHYSSSFSSSRTSATARSPTVTYQV